MVPRLPEHHAGTAASRSLSMASRLVEVGWPVVRMYDISNGKADSWSWLLGAHFPAFWHTSVVVDFEEPLEFWYGGKLFVSSPGTTPFGQPLEKRFIGPSQQGVGPQDTVTSA